ncbi:hypothetical protein Ccrd_011506 [Cynara cardunculus var. scolymus]|uniref:Uncharacterized protein n=1 Tax=Cynara cardunculus var. scolymus TaxID=59895 RepID=A0A103YJ42_CYNCS|nr:hypothetical protein Ccrd_011506 [Cynara cardunculus var. scolymus]
MHHILSSIQNSECIGNRFAPSVQALSWIYAVVINADFIAAGLQSGCLAFSNAATPLT